MFVVALLVTGSLAVAMSLFTLADPLAVHPHLAGRSDAALVRDIFGWMMRHVGLLTICLTWYCWLASRNGRDVTANRLPNRRIS